ncbi:MAG: hypothetical protein FH756_08305 [Firmicutes bacterium]|nr:hypothetical protein [Bacillota bacterium]
MDILHLIKSANLLLGTGVVTSSVYLYVTQNAKIPLLISLAIVIAGPIEDLLTNYVEESPSLSPNDKKHYTDFIDQSTSLAFLALLGLAVLCTVD